MSQSVFHAHYWRDCARLTTQKLCVMGVLMALQIILSRITAINLGNWLRISFGFLPNAMGLSKQYADTYLWGFVAFAALEVGVLAWVVLLMILALKEMNGYSVGKTVLMIFLSLFTMVMIWAMVVLLFTIASQFVGMIREMFYEVIYRID